VGTNGTKPVAVLEVLGRDADGEKNEETPLIQFDQTFLSPLFARYQQDGELFSIRAISDLETRRDRPRFTHVVASRLEVAGGGKALATFIREEPEQLEKPSPTKAPQTITDISALKRTLSLQGQAFLSALLATH
jgi:hypothetical protein